MLVGEQGQGEGRGGKGDFLCDKRFPAPVSSLIKWASTFLTGFLQGVNKKTHVQCPTQSWQRMCPPQMPAHLSGSGSGSPSESGVVLGTPAWSFWRHFRHAPQTRQNRTQTDTSPSHLGTQPPTLGGGGRCFKKVLGNHFPENLPRSNLCTWQEMSDGHGQRKLLRWSLSRRSSPSWLGFHVLLEKADPDCPLWVQPSDRSCDWTWRSAGRGHGAPRGNVPTTPVPEPMFRGGNEARLRKAFARGRSEAGRRTAWPGSDQVFSSVMTARWLVSLLVRTAPSASPHPRKPTAHSVIKLARLMVPVWGPGRQAVVSHGAAEGGRATPPSDSPKA